MEAGWSIDSRYLHAENDCPISSEGYDAILILVSDYDEELNDER